jgi:L-ascorbate metabolism protein UlaG (beta-lactamase superfamily)
METAMEKIKEFERDVFPSSQGDLGITFLGHGSLLFDFNRLKIYVDPYSQVCNYAKLPPADLILITHEHHDHLDLSALSCVRTEKTVLIANPAAVSQLKGGQALHNGQQTVASGIPVEAVPAYNLLHKRPDGQPFHPKGVGNGYILTFSDLRVYIAGDSENIPDMKVMRDIQIAFLPMNLPYTMTPEMVADAARAFRPKILYPYHYGSTDPALLKNLLGPDSGIEVRIRRLA